MLDANHIAFKEWAAICEALAAGAQVLILRKGGIHEGREGFRVAHPEFWLFPTYVHEAAAGLEPEAGIFLERAEADQPPEGMLRLAHYAIVNEAHDVHSESQLTALAGQHVWSAKTVGDRFHYRRPGLYALTVRVYTLREPHVVPDSPHFGGCRSWVELPAALPTDGLEAVLNDDEFERRRALVSRALAQTG